MKIGRDGEQDIRASSCWTRKGASPEQEVSD